MSRHSRPATTAALAVLLAGGVAVAGSASAAASGHGGDPKGNNGTFKVDGPPFGPGMANEPHVACTFNLKFFGFDDGQRGDVTIAGHAPSGSGTVNERDDVEISDDAAGGGPNDPDAVLSYTAGDLDLSGLTAHPKQGYHLKVTLTTDTPGGVKHKVFWYRPCGQPTESASPTPSVVVSATETATPSATESVSPTTSASATVSATVSATSTETASPTVSASVLGVKLTRNAPPAVLGTTVTRPGGLPFTGAMAAGLAALGAALLGTGVLVTTAARRKARHLA